MKDALEYLESSKPFPASPLIVIKGDEDFLKRLVRQRLVADLLGDADPAFALSPFEADAAPWSTVKSELDTLPFLSPRRVVMIEQADPFVTENRARLEDLIAAKGGSGTLILDVKSWPANTKLAKATVDQTIEAKSPRQPSGWCRTWAKKKYGKELTADAADWLVELVGPALGQLDQEIDKLATFVGAGKQIGKDVVDRLVGRTREAETFKIFDAIGAGRTADALSILQRLIADGESPIAILGAFSWQMRRLAALSRISRRGVPLAQAFNDVGVPPFARQGLEQQLRHIGRRRMDRIYDWLIETDLGLKGSSQLPDHLLLETLIVKLARKEPAGIG